MCHTGVFIFFVYVINNQSLENGTLQLPGRGMIYDYVIGLHHGYRVISDATMTHKIFVDNYDVISVLCGRQRCE